MEFRISMLPISGGDATLLSAGGAHLLIDTGARSEEAANFLDREGVRRIELLVLSHVDLDHIGGLRSVIQRVKVDEIWCLDIYRIRDALDQLAPVMNVAERRSAADLTYRFTKIDTALKSIKAKSIPVSMPFEGEHKKCAHFDVEVLWPPRDYFKFVLEPANLRRLLTAKGSGLPEAWISKKPLGHRELERARKTIAQRIGCIASKHPDSLDEERAKQPWPARKFVNNLSSVLSIGFDKPQTDARMLFPGDLEDWDALVMRHWNSLPSPIWKLPHHGSVGVNRNHGGPEALVRLINPSASLLFPYPPHGLPSIEDKSRKHATRWGKLIENDCRDSEARRSWRLDCVVRSGRCEAAVENIFPVSAHLEGAVRKNTCSALPRVAAEASPAAESIKDALQQWLIQRYTLTFSLTERTAPFEIRDASIARGTA